MTEGMASDHDRRNNLIMFASLLFGKMSEKYGGTTTLNELRLLNYGFVCSARGEDICLMNAVRDLGIHKSTASRILKGLRAKHFIVETAHPTDRRRKAFRLADAYLNRGDSDIQEMLQWRSATGNSLVQELDYPKID